MVYPVALDLRGRRCVVVGGGSVGERKVAALLPQGADVTVVSPEVTTALERLAAAGRLRLLKREFGAADLDGAFMVFAATDDPAVNEEVYRLALQRGLLVNAADDPARCNFYLPAVLVRGDLAIAVSTGGKSPALARRIRERLEAEFGPEYGAWLEILGEVRSRLKGCVADRRARESLLFALVDEPMYLRLLREGRAGEVRDLVRQELARRLAKLDNGYLQIPE